MREASRFESRLPQHRRVVAVAYAILIFSLLLTLLACPRLLAGGSPGDRWLELTTRGQAALHAGRFEAAEALLRQSLLEAEQAERPGTRLAVSLNNLGAALQSRGRQAEAESLYRRALGEWKKAWARATRSR